MLLYVIFVLFRSLGLAVAPRIRFMKKQQQQQEAAAQRKAAKASSSASTSASAAAVAGSSAEEQDSGIDESKQAGDAKPYKPLFRTAYNFHDGEQ